MTGPQTSASGREGEARPDADTQLDLAYALAQLGMDRADAAQPQDWRDHVDRVITAMARTGQPFTSDHVSVITVAAVLAVLRGDLSLAGE